MQIFEITVPDQSAAIAEANLGAIGKALGSAAVAAAGQYVNKQTGMNLAGGSANPYAGPNARDKAMTAAMTMSKPQAKQQKALFDRALSQLMAEKGVTSTTALAPSDTKALSQNLYQQIIKNLLQNNLTDYADLPKYVRAGTPQQEASKLVQQITNAMTTIQEVQRYDPKNPAAIQQAWESLTQATNQALVMMQFDKAGAQPGSAQPNTPPTNINPAVQQMAKTAAAGKLTAQQLNIKPTVISNLQSKFPPGTDPKIDALFQALGLYPTP